MIRALYKMSLKAGFGFEGIQYAHKNQSQQVLDGRWLGKTDLIPIPIIGPGVHVLDP